MVTKSKPFTGTLSGTRNNVENTLRGNDAYKARQIGSMEGMEAALRLTESLESLRRERDEARAKVEALTQERDAARILEVREVCCAGCKRKYSVAFPQGIGCISELGCACGWRTPWDEAVRRAGQRETECEHKLVNAVGGRCCACGKQMFVGHYW